MQLDNECRQLLEQLAGEGFLRLPPLRPWGGRGSRKPNVSPADSEPPPLECAARECEPLELVLVEGEAESRRWRQSMQRYHYLAHRQQHCVNLR